MRATLPREKLVMAQTPQVFRYDLLVRAFETARQDGFIGTDESSMVERLDVEVSVVPGSDRNIKITKPTDMELAHLFLREETAGRARLSEIRTGLGWDVHRIAAGRPLILGGVTVPCDFGLEGHSDADVLAHAITDAILGAAALGDIGMHFPDTDPRWKGCDSLVFLRHAARLAEERGYRIVNVDSTVILERPKLKDYRQTIRERLAKALGLELDRVSVKFKTAEKVGPVGEGRSAEAQAIVTLERKPSACLRASRTQRAKRSRSLLQSFCQLSPPTHRIYLRDDLTLNPCAALAGRRSSPPSPSSPWPSASAPTPPSSASSKASSSSPSRHPAPRTTHRPLAHRPRRQPH